VKSEGREGEGWEGEGWKVKGVKHVSWFEKSKKYKACFTIVQGGEH